MQISGRRALQAEKQEVQRSWICWCVQGITGDQGSWRRMCKVHGVGRNDIRLEESWGQIKALLSIFWSFGILFQVNGKQWKNFLKSDMITFALKRSLWLAMLSTVCSGQVHRQETSNSNARWVLVLELYISSLVWVRCLTKTFTSQPASGHSIFLEQFTTHSDFISVHGPTCPQSTYFPLSLCDTILGEEDIWPFGSQRLFLWA